MKNCNLLKVAFYIRQNRNTRKDYSIYCCIKLSGSRKTELCVANSIGKNEWDEGKGRPKQTSDHLIKLSIYLEDIKARLFDIYFDIKHRNEELAANVIKNIYLGKGTDLTMLKLMDQAIHKFEIELAKGSLKNYGATRAYVEKFCKQKYKSGDVQLKFLKYNFIDELKTYILCSPIKPNDPCTNNGCMKHLERVKKIITWAYEMRFIDRDVFAAFKIKKHPFESRRLYWEQLKLLQSKTFQLPMLNLVKDLFVFGCYTGMAPVDIQHLEPHQIHLEPDGITWLSYIRTKSKVAANVPLLSPALTQIKKYEWKKGDAFRSTVFPLVTNKDLNTNLKVISEICGLGMPFNFYIARYTFATTVTLMHDVPITTIKEMLGHRKFESTMHYARLDKLKISQDMMLLEEKLSL